MDRINYIQSVSKVGVTLPFKLLEDWYNTHLIIYGKSKPQEVLELPGMRKKNTLS